MKRDVEDALARGVGRSSGGGGLAQTVRAGVILPVTAPPFTDGATSQMRKIIAERLVESKTQAPHFYLQVSVDMARAMDLRKQVNTLQDAVKVSVNDLIVKAVALAGRDVPRRTPPGTRMGEPLSFASSRKCTSGLQLPWKTAW